MTEHKAFYHLDGAHGFLVLYHGVDIGGCIKNRCFSSNKNLTRALLLLLRVELAGPCSKL
jgi:hypothetical protein